jgi:hypothetical protein
MGRPSCILRDMSCCHISGISSKRNEVYEVFVAGLMLLIAYSSYAPYLRSLRTYAHYAPHLRSLRKSSSSTAEAEN